MCSPITVLRPTPDEAIGDGPSGDLATKADLAALRAELVGEIRLIRWIGGFILAFVVAMAWRMFFGGG